MNTKPTKNQEILLAMLNDKALQAAKKAHVEAMKKQVAHKQSQKKV